MSKKKFKDTTVGQLLFGAASVINPTLGNVKLMLQQTIR